MLGKETEYWLQYFLEKFSSNNLIKVRCKAVLDVKCLKAIVSDLTVAFLYLLLIPMFDTDKSRPA